MEKIAVETMVHHPECAVVSPFGQLRGVTAYCTCDEHGGPITEREFKRLRAEWLRIRRDQAAA